MSRLWFWLVGVTLFALTFTYQGFLEPQSFGAKRTEAARQRVVQAADLGGIAGVLRSVLFRQGGETGPAE